MLCTRGLFVAGYHNMLSANINNPLDGHKSLSAENMLAKLSKF